MGVRELTNSRTSSATTRFKTFTKLAFMFILPVTNDLSVKNVLTIVMRRHGEKSRLFNSSAGRRMVTNTKCEMFKDRKERA